MRLVMYTLVQSMVKRILALVLILAGAAPAQDLSTIEHSLRQSYEKRVLALRNFYSDSQLQYDAAGTLVGTGHIGPWTLSYVVLNKIKLSQSQLELRGTRVAARIQTEANHVSYIRRSQGVRIVIATSATPGEATLRNALDRIFFTPGTNFAPFVPDYWRDLLAGNIVRIEESNGRPAHVGFRNNCPLGVSADAPPEVDPSGADKIFCGGLTIYHVRTGIVIAPKPLKTPDPKYVEAARQEKYQGTVVLWLVVDQTGHVEMIRIVRALGMGLDDAAVETVRGWLFKPAEFKGKPVAVQINVETNFRLY